MFSVIRPAVYAILLKESVEYIGPLLLSDFGFGIKSVIRNFCLFYRALYEKPHRIHSGLWTAESSMEILLAVNRCLELLAPSSSSSHLVDHLFGGCRAWAWVALPLAYGLYVFGFQSPGSFNGLVFAWMFYPHYGYVEQTLFGDAVRFTIEKDIVVTYIISNHLTLQRITPRRCIKEFADLDKLPMHMRMIPAVTGYNAWKKCYKYE
jgi:hypothetical protein